MKKSLLFLILTSLTYFPNNGLCQSSWDDFDVQGKVTYPFFNGSIFNQTFSNPATTGVNTSTLCAQYARSSGSQYDVILVEPSGTNKIGSVSDYRTGTKKMTMKVYSPVVGKTIQITLENKTTAQPTNFPTGRHSEYTAVTTVANSWETLTFNLANRPDPTVADTSVSRMVILFDPNSYNSDTYLFDDIMGPDMLDPCSSVAIDTSIGEDYECQRNVAFTFANGTHLQSETNPSQSGINTSAICGKFIKFTPPTNDGAFGGSFNHSFYSTAFNKARIDLYNPNATCDFMMVMQDNAGNNVKDTTFTVPSSTNWATFEMDLTSISPTIELTSFVLLLNPATSTVDTIHIDNFEFFKDNSTSQKENNGIAQLSLYPNPFSDQLTISSDNQLSEVTLLDLTGKRILYITQINSNRIELDQSILNEGSYLIQIKDKDGRLTTKKIIKSVKK